MNRHRHTFENLNLNHAEPITDPGARDFVDAMLDLQRRNPGAYAVLRAECWDLVAANEGKGRSGAELRSEYLRSQRQVQP